MGHSSSLEWPGEALVGGCNLGGLSGSYPRFRFVDVSKVVNTDVRVGAIW